MRKGRHHVHDHAFGAGGPHRGGGAQNLPNFVGRGAASNRRGHMAPMDELALDKVTIVRTPVEKANTSGLKTPVEKVSTPTSRVLLGHARKLTRQGRQRSRADGRRSAHRHADVDRDPAQGARRGSLQAFGLPDTASPTRPCRRSLPTPSLPATGESRPAPRPSSGPTCPSSRRSWPPTERRPPNSITPPRGSSSASETSTSTPAGSIR